MTLQLEKNYEGAVNAGVPLKLVAITLILTEHSTNSHDTGRSFETRQGDGRTVLIFYEGFHGRSQRY